MLSVILGSNLYYEKSLCIQVEVHSAWLSPICEFQVIRFSVLSQFLAYELNMVSFLLVIHKRAVDI